MPSKIVLITGCSTGIGHDLARRLARANYTVIATARHPGRLSDLHVALQLPLDVTDPTSVASATQEVVRRFGRIDILVNNAGYAVRGAVEDIPVEQVQQMFDVNVYGVMRMILYGRPVHAAAESRACDYHWFARRETRASGEWDVLGDKVCPGSTQ